MSAPRSAHSRTQILLFLLACLTAVAWLGPQIAPSTAESAVIAKKKKKKCKQGYTKKKVGGKTRCVKKSATVESVRLDEAKGGGPLGIELIGSVKLKKPVASLSVAATASWLNPRSGRETKSQSTVVASDGVSLVVPFRVVAPRFINNAGGAPVTYWVVVDGVKSNVK